MLTSGGPATRPDCVRARGRRELASPFGFGKAARDGAGWHEYLDRLVSELDGTPQRPVGELWVEVHPRYVTQLGPDAATIGPPAGNDPRGTNA